MHVHVLYIHIHISSFILNSAFGFEHIASVCACVCVCDVFADYIFERGNSVNEREPTRGTTTQGYSR